MYFCVKSLLHNRKLVPGHRDLPLTASVYFIQGGGPSVGSWDVLPVFGVSLFCKGAQEMAFVRGDTICPISQLRLHTKHHAF